MKREFKGQICAYCSVRVSKTDDHVFAAKFFLERHRDKTLPKAPACKPCNGTKCALENYLTAVLPLGGRHEHALENLEVNVPGRVAGNLKLARELSTSTQPAWLKEGDGLYLPTSMMPFDLQKLAMLLKYIGRGLAWYHWRVYVPAHGFVGVLFPADSHSAILPGLLQPDNFPIRISQSIGNDTIRYEGMQASDPATLTVWKVMMYGGVVLGSDKRSGGEPSEARSQWWIVTGPPELRDRWTEFLKK